MDVKTIRALGYHLIFLADNLEKTKGGVEKAKEEQKCDKIKKKTNIKDKSEKENPYFQENMAPKMTSSINEERNSSSDAAIPSASMDETTKISLATFFTQMSGMNLEWSVKCLEQNNWDLDMAKANFNVAASKGKIPPHAFQS